MRTEFSKVFGALHQVWENNPDALVLLMTGFLIFVVVILDATRHRRHLPND